MHLREALEQIAEIRLRMAQSELFRGYRAIPAACSGMIAVLAGVLQPMLMPQPMEQVEGYLLLWVGVAAFSILIVLLTIGMRDWFAGSSQTRMLTWLALWQFVPSIIAGTGISVIIVRFAPEGAWLLPGLWQLFYSQGLFASCRFLPRAGYGVAGFYLLSGILTLLLAQGDSALSPLAMAIPFGIGQLYSAAVLYWTLERHEKRQPISEQS